MQQQSEFYQHVALIPAGLLMHFTKGIKIEFLPVLQQKKLYRNDHPPCIVQKRQLLKAIGRRSTVLPGLLTKFLVGALRTVPRWGKVRIMKIVMGGMTKHQRSD